MDSLTALGFKAPAEPLTSRTALGPSLVPPTRKVWRVPIDAKELIAAGFDPRKIDVDWWETVIKPLMLAKGLPEGFTLERTPARISTTRTGLMLEFV